MTAIQEQDREHARRLLAEIGPPSDDSAYYGGPGWRELYRRLRDEGWTYTRIARLSGISAQTVSRHMKHGGE
jgi:hypothetical protein